MQGIVKMSIGVLLTAIVHYYLDGYVRNAIADDPANPTFDESVKISNITVAGIGIPAIIYNTMFCNEDLIEGSLSEHVCYITSGVIFSETAFVLYLFSKAFTHYLD